MLLRIALIVSVLAYGGCCGEPDEGILFDCTCTCDDDSDVTVSSCADSSGEALDSANYRCGAPAFCGGGSCSCSCTDTNQACVEDANRCGH